MDSETTLFSGMDAETAFEMFSESDKKYRIKFDCGSAEAARRQRVAGVGEVNEDGKYVRETYSDTMASLASEDPNAVVEVI